MRNATFFRLFHTDALIFENMTKYEKYEEENYLHRIGLQTAKLLQRYHSIYV